MKILWFNWKDIKNPLAGGAEVYTHEIARRLSEYGFKVVLVASAFPGCRFVESISGYKVIRVGNSFTVYFRSMSLYKSILEKINPDVVIDEVNTIPFFTPFYVDKPIVVLIHQLCRDCWRYNTVIPNRMGWSLEKIIHKIYVRASESNSIRKVVTVSPSSKADLVSLGYDPEIIEIVYNGLDLSRYSACMGNERIHAVKDDKTICYIGRLSPYKRIEHVILAYKLVKSIYDTSTRLVIAGRGGSRYISKLKNYAKSIRGDIVFKINISHSEKLRLLRECSVMLYTSIREGWGQTVMEAAVCGTPTVAYDVPGLRDSTTLLGAGVLVEEGNIVELARRTIELLQDPRLRASIINRALLNIRYYTWDRAARKFKEVIEEAVR